MGIMTDERTAKRDMVLPPGTYAYMQDVTKGIIKTYTGPSVINPTAQEVPVVYDDENGRFLRTDLESAVKKAVIAPEGYYIILLNPAKGDKQVPHPQEGQTQPSADLDVGRKIVIPGPAMFPLWPGQAAQVIRGHQIRLNQYILARVYNEAEAQKNWNQAVMKPASGEGTDIVAAPSIPPPEFTVGTQIIIRGDQVSFYIPPTGIAVVKDGEQYVREALTLERLEYCILIDQNGKKRYEKGPQVVFPKPTERFVETKHNGEQTRKFQAIELNELQGLQIKVIADYTEGGRTYKAGEELFITGKDTSIYYPREEHSIIKYDGNTKHFATAIPAGEGRYVMNRNTGEIKTVKGPAMLLPDPRNEVIVRRVLTDKQASLWYPGNFEVAEYNKALRSILSIVPSTRSGAVSEGDFSRNFKGASGGQKMTKSATVPDGRLSNTVVSSVISDAAPAQMESSRVGGNQQAVGDEFSRASTYTQPRTVDLNTKFQGAPAIEVHTGYAIQVVSKTGKRRVEKGPVAILVDYDESLEALELSTGKPKTTDKLINTVYLRVDNNKVTDYVNVETQDHVKVKLSLSYLVNFEGDPLKWFAVENYVKFACDHFRSILKGSIRKLKVEDFYANSTDIVRDLLLGTTPELAKAADPRSKRPGLLFEENGMRLVDIEVLGVELLDDRIRQLLDQSQQQVVQSNIELSNAKRNLDLTKQKELITREETQVKSDTKKQSDLLSIDLLVSQLAVTLTKYANQLKEHEAAKAERAASEAVADLVSASQLERARKAQDQEMANEESQQELRLTALAAETQATISRFTSVLPGFSASLEALSSKDTMVQVAKAWSLQTAIGGESVSDALSRVFNNTPLKPLLEKVVSMSKNGSNLANPGTSPAVA